MKIKLHKYGILLYISGLISILTLLLLVTIISVNLYPREISIFEVMSDYHLIMIWIMFFIIMLTGLIIISFDKFLMFKSKINIFLKDSQSTNSEDSSNKE